MKRGRGKLPAKPSSNGAAIMIAAEIQALVETGRPPATKSSVFIGCFPAVQTDDHVRPTTQTGRAIKGDHSDVRVLVVDHHNDLQPSAVIRSFITAILSRGGLAGFDSDPAGAGLARCSNIAHSGSPKNNSAGNTP